MATCVDRFGRVVIPKPIRERLGLEAGTKVTIEEERGAVVITAVREDPLLVVEEGILVYMGKAEGDLALAEARLREKRTRDLMGPRKP